MSTLGGVRFHKRKKFRTHMQTTTLGHWEGLFTVQTTDSTKTADLPGPSQVSRILRLPGGVYQYSTYIRVCIVTMVPTKTGQSLIIKFIIHVFQ